MSKLYIFGIGGTGIRVLKSLTMLLAAGVDCGVDTIIPIIIDRDESNGDFTKTKLLIENYLAVNKIARETEINRFFKTKIELWYCCFCGQYYRAYYDLKKITPLIEKEV